MNHLNHIVQPYSTSSSSSPQSNMNLRILNCSQHDVAGKQLTLLIVQPILNSEKSHTNPEPRTKGSAIRSGYYNGSQELPSIRQKQHGILPLGNMQHDSKVVRRDSTIPVILFNHAHHHHHHLPNATRT